MTAQHAELSSSHVEEDAAQALERQKAANRAEEDKFLAHLTGESAQAFMFNRDERLRMVVAQNLANNFEHRLQDLTTEELAQHFHDALAMVASEASSSYNEARDAELAATQKENEALKAQLKSEIEHRSQLTYDLRVARAELHTEFMGQEDVQSLIHDKLSAIEFEHPTAPVLEALDDSVEPEDQPESTREVLRILGKAALRLPGVGARSVTRGVKVITGQIEKTAS